MNIERGFQLQDLRGMLKRRASLIAGVALAVLLLSILIAFWLPNQYSAAAMLLVEPQVISREILKTGVEKSDLNQRLHIMTAQILSRGRLSKIIDEFKLYPSESRWRSREEVIDYMRKHLRVEPVLPELEQGVLRRTQDYEINTFKLFFIGDDPDTAANVANRLANDFIEEHLKERVQVSGDTSEFLEAELTRLNSRVQQVDTRMAQLKAENAGRLPEDLQANQNLLERAIDNLRAVQRDLSVAQSDEAFYKQQALMTPGAPTIGQETTPGQRREILQQELEQYKSRGYTDEHPDVVAAREELKELEKRMGGGKGGGLLSFAQQNAESESRRAAIRVESAQSEVKRLNDQIDDLEKRIADTPRVQEEMAALELEAKQLGESYKEFSNKRLDANVAANVERRQKGEQFRVLEAAFPPPAPSSPYRGVIVLVGLVLGLSMGFGAGVLAESADTSFHGTADLQAALRVPVLVAIPAIMLDADRVLMRRRRMRKLLYAVGVSGVVLVAAVGGYAYNNGLPGLRSRGTENAPPPAEAPNPLPANPIPAAAPPAAAPPAATSPGEAPPAAASPAPAPPVAGGEGKG
jgi:polysaccharide chain length determinant protein (PEP-CTERM system associated)